MSTHRLTVAGNRLGRGIPVLDPLPFSTMVTALARRLSLLRFPDIGGGNGGETGNRPSQRNQGLALSNRLTPSH